ncbi:MAG: hypA [Clostridiales bacterium]|jgi:Zn-dependent M16 (insulinase) family peptidase|nr:hypA [Clostridiales bacterium]
MTAYKVGHEYYGYELVDNKQINELDSTALVFRHIKSGARVLLISNDDNNKVFSIGFRTPPNDDTGLPHILEHSVLCGSRKFPLKDPFNELVKGSLNTFLNAMTFSDKTIYPVASCNTKDFKNLMDVYMDAVFYPNIYEYPEIFKQEGWHYELLEEDAEIEYKGVVYNEMKGAFSSPEQVLFRKIQSSLMPDTAYSHESGGDPDNIPELSYEEFLEFHKKYYHPSNSYIYLYGDFDIKEKLEWMDKEYLCEFDKIEVNSEISMQKPFSEPREEEVFFSLLENENEENKTYLTYNFVVGNVLDKYTTYAFEILEYLLLDAPGAPLKKELINAGIGKDVFGSYDRDMLQPTFSIVAKDTEASKKEEFKNVIESTLKKIVAEGIDKRKIEAAINYHEFKIREADYGRYPKGIMYGILQLSSWLYDEKKPFLHLEYNSVFEKFKADIDSNYFEQLIQKYLMNNNHSNIVIAKPKKGLTEQIDKETKAKLAEYKATLSKEEINQLIADNKALLEYQETPSSPEDLEKIPLLDIADIEKKSKPLIIEKYDLCNTRTLLHKTFTNNITYLKLIFDIKKVSTEMIPYISLLASVLGNSDTDNYEYAELSNEININTGGIYSDVNIYSMSDDAAAFTPKFVIGAKAFYEKTPTVFELISEIVFRTRFMDTKRIYDIIAEQKSRLQSRMNSAGHVVAANRAESYFSPAKYYTELTSGIDYFRFIEDLEANFETKKDELLHYLKKLTRYIFRKENLLISITSDGKDLEQFQNDFVRFVDELYTDEIENIRPNFELKQSNEGFMTSSKVQYVATAGNFLNEGYKYTGALKVLSSIASREYLWNNVRVKGGAYGCMCGFARTGNVFFTSYRDPNLKQTLNTFDGIVKYIENFDVDDRDMTKYIIGTISDVDIPQTPAGKGERSLVAYLTNVSFEDIQQERDEILSTDCSKIRELAQLVKAVLDQKNICVVGNEAKIKENKDEFKTIQNLFK